MTFLQMVARLILVICLLSSPARALAWGIGHNSQADQVWRALPEEFLRHFDERQRLDFVVHYSHYTDYYTAREPKHRSEPAAETCAEAVRRLKFNPHKTQFVFPLFVEALREERHEDALMWAACLAHSIGDMGALNHPDLLWFSHVCLGDSGVMGPGGKSVPAVFAPDAIYGRSYFEEEFQPIYDEAMDGYVGRVISDDPQAVLEHLIVRDHLRKEEMNADLEVLQIFLLMEQYSRDGLPATYRKITEGLAAYTAKTNREILDTLATGFAFARLPEMPTFDIELAAKEASQTLKASRENGIQAKDMIHFSATWREGNQEGAVGVIISDRPSLVYSGGCPFGSKHQWMTSIVLQSLKQEGLPYRCLSYERTAGFDAEQNPVLVIVSPGSAQGLRKPFLDGLVEYVQSGGRLIWLGGGVPETIADLLPPGGLPEIAEGDAFKFPFPIREPDRKTEATFVDLTEDTRFVVPDLNLGKFTWNTFGECRCLYFDAVGDIPEAKAIMRLELPGSDPIVGVKREVDRGEIVYLPWFTICPFMLSDDREMKSLVNLSLDETGGAILMPWLRER